jgi:predicted 3-demethylubiquinone-9 3-methyltransferase (glyoxalase superfamily)
MTKQKVRTFLWFNDTAAEAAGFYTSIFKNSKIQSQSPMIVEFELAGSQYIALNGGPAFQFNEAISLFVDCADQAEIDELWGKLSEGGSPGQCGWLKDRYGLSWQIVPAVLQELMSDPSRASRVMAALMTMTKISIKELQNA